jgi:hypothetical protein
VNSYLTHTRIAAVVALLAFGFGVVSDVTAGGFWGRHALLAGLVSSVLVVMVSVAVINEVLERRRRRRWSVLAQYVMVELVRNARMVWLGILDVAGMVATGASQPESLDVGAQLVRDTPALTSALCSVMDHHDGRTRVHEEIAFLAGHADEVMARWASVMLSAEVYADVIDRHVELAGDVAWINGMLDNADPPADALRRRRARSSPAVQIEPGLGSEWLASRIVVVAQLAERLDRGTLDLALRIVPVEWWEARLTATDDPRRR